MQPRKLRQVHDVFFITHDNVLARDYLIVLVKYQVVAIGNEGKYR